MEEENESPQVIRVVTKLPNEEAKAVEIKNDYRTISDFCKGMIDMVDHPKDQHISIICNDEFLFNGMEPNIVAPEREEVLCGPLIFCGYDPETGDSISLTEEQVDKYTAMFAEPEEISDEEVQADCWIAITGYDD